MESIGIYFNQINSIPLLTAEQEKDLAAKAARGDKSAIDALVVSNLRFVVRVANAYKNYLAAGGPDGGDGGKGGSVIFKVNDNLATLADFRYKRKYTAQNGQDGSGGRKSGKKGEDLIMEGNVALMTAARKFDPAKNVRFCTYAVWWIKNAIYRALSKKIKTSSWTAARLDVIYKASEEDDAQPLINYFPDEKFLGPERLAVNANMVELVDAALAVLKPKEREVIKCRFGFDNGECMTLQEIGDKLGHTKEGIRQIEKSGLGKLRAEFDLVA